LYRFLRLRPADLEKFANLGEGRFSRLWHEDTPPAGLGRLARKIGSDYTRAEERRLHVLMAVLLNEVRADLTRRARAFDQLAMPEPFANLVSERDLISLHGKYSNDVRLVMEPGGMVAILSAAVVPVSSSAPAVIGIRTPRRRPGRGAPTSGAPREPTAQPRLIDMALAKEAEDYVQHSILEPQHGDRLVRVGHTALEFSPLADGAVPGADFYVRSPGSAREAAFYEVKSAATSKPPSIHVTRAEYDRAVKCHGVGTPYELFVVAFERRGGAPTVYRIPDFAARSANLSINYLIGFDLALDFL
jgi:hypothetical protein